MGCCWMSCDFTVETEEDNSEDQEDKNYEEHKELSKNGTEKALD